MPANKQVNPRKQRIGQKFRDMMDTYSRVISFGMDLVGSRQLALIRQNLRGRAEFLFGKNTMLRKVLRDRCGELEADEPEKASKLMNMMSLIEGNVGLCFTNEDIKTTKDYVEAQTLACPAKVGIIAPCPVYVKSGPTGCDPTQTSFFQMMEIPTKINRGQVEIVADVCVIKLGEKVGASQASLCAKLNITPFAFGPQGVRVYDDGDVYATDVLDITDEMIENGFKEALRKAAALCMGAELPNALSVPHYIYKAWLDTCAMLLATEMNEKTPLWQKFLDSFGSGGGGGGGGGAGGDAGGAAAPVEEEEEEEESDDAPQAAGLFGGGSSDESSS